MSKRKGILLIGPTGSGKTPLGDLLEQHGLGSQQLVHFDFGVHLRRVESCAKTRNLLEDWELEVVRRVLHEGLLLEDDAFSIAEKLLLAFLSGKPDHALVVLNGMPRHLGQATAIDRWVHIIGLIVLQCTLEDVLTRIQVNVGGDRDTRTDDSESDIAAKMEIFEKRTRRLVTYYAEKGVRVDTIRVTPSCRPADVMRAVADLDPF